MPVPTAVDKITETAHTLGHVSSHSTHWSLTYSHLVSGTWHQWGNSDLLWETGTHNQHYSSPGP